MDERTETGRTLEALRRKNLEGKKTFVEELRHQQTPQALSLLLEILCDESWYLRGLAVAALAEVGARAVPPLRRLLATGLWYTRAAAAQALGRIGDGASTGTILTLVTEPNLAVQNAGAAALKDMVAALGAGVLSEALAALPAEARARRLEALDRIAPELVRALEEAPSPPPPTNAAPAPAASAEPRPPSTSTGAASHEERSAMRPPELFDLPRVSDKQDAPGGRSKTP